MEAQISEFGQTPTQLFIVPHPHRNRFPSSSATSQAANKLSQRDVADLLDFLSAPSTPTEECVGDVLGQDHSLGDKTLGQLPVSLAKAFSHRLHRDVVTSMCLSQDGSTIYSVSQDTALKL